LWSSARQQCDARPTPPLRFGGGGRKKNWRNLRGGGGHIEMRRLAEYFGPALYTCRLLKQQPAHQATRPNRGHIQSRTAAESPRRPAVQHEVREPHYKPVQGNPPQPGTSEWRPCSERLANKRRMSHPLGSEWVGEAAVNN